MSTTKKYLNKNKSIPFCDAEKIAEEIIDESDYSELRKEKLKNTLWHEFGHAMAAKRNKQTLNTLRTNRWFIVFDEKYNATIWCFHFLNGSMKNPKEDIDVYIEDLNDISGDGSCFMTLDNDLSDFKLIEILKAENRRSIKQKTQYSETTDNGRIFKIYSNILQNKISKFFKNEVAVSNEATTELKAHLNEVGKMRINDCTTEEQSINIKGLKAVKRIQNK